MATSPSSVPAKEAPNSHLELTQAHHQAARLARSLYEGLAPVFQMDLANTQK